MARDGGYIYIIPLKPEPQKILLTFFRVERIQWRRRQMGCLSCRDVVARVTVIRADQIVSHVDEKLFLTTYLRHSGFLINRFI